MNWKFSYFEMLLTISWESVYLFVISLVLPIYNAEKLSVLKELLVFICPSNVSMLCYYCHSYICLLYCYLCAPPHSDVVCNQSGVVMDYCITFLLQI